MSMQAETAFDVSRRTVNVASRRASGTVAGMLWARVDRHLNPTRAMVLSLVLLAIASWADVATTAEATFTLVYVVPLAIAVWYTGLRAAYVISALSVLSGLVVDFVSATHITHPSYVVWNNLIDGALFVVFAHVLASLRARVHMEAELRMDALNQLRHAERLTTIGKLASGVAHEIGTPLNVISGHAELLVMGRVSSEGIEGTGRILLEQSERVTTIVRQLLDFSRRGGTRVESTDIRELAESTGRLLQSSAKKSGVQIVVEGESFHAPINRSELQQVLTNLMTNAIHAMPNGGLVTVDIHSERTRAPEERHASPKDYVVLSISDVGTGIAPDVLPKIFDPFFTTKDVGQGTGLGLSVAYGIVRDHNGWVSVNTRFGVGTKFSVYLPKNARTSSRDG